MSITSPVRRALAFLLSGVVVSGLWLFGANGVRAQTTSTTSASTTTSTVATTTSTTTAPSTTTTTVAGATPTTLVDCGPIDRVVLADGSVICAHPEDPDAARPATAVAGRVTFTG